MTTSISRSRRDTRYMEKLAAALLAAFRNLEPGERFKLIRRVRLRQSWRIGGRHG